MTCAKTLARGQLTPDLKNMQLFQIIQNLIDIFLKCLLGEYAYYYEYIV